VPAAIRGRKWANVEEFVNTLGRQYQQGLDSWEQGDFADAVSAMATTERLLALSLPTYQHKT